MIEQQDVQNFRTEMLALQSLCVAGSVTVRCKSRTDLYATLTKTALQNRNTRQFVPLFVTEAVLHCYFNASFSSINIRHFTEKSI